MRTIDFKTWFDNSGHNTYDEIIDWLYSAPDTVDIDELLGGNLEEYAFSLCEEEYESQVSEYEDRCYDEYRDSLLFDDD